MGAGKRADKLLKGGTCKLSIWREGRMKNFTAILEGVAVSIIENVCKRIGLVDIINHLAGNKTHKKNVPPIGERTKLMITNRLTSPTPLYKIKDWFNNNGLEMFYGCKADSFNDDALGRALEKIADNGSLIISKVSLAAADAYNLKFSKLYTDVTSISFEGAYEKSNQIKHGYNRDKRPDLKQLNISLNVDPKSRLPLGFDVYAGNTPDAKIIIPSTRKK